MQTLNGKKVVTIRDAKAGDPGFDASKKQSRVELEDHSQATVLTSDVKTEPVVGSQIPKTAEQKNHDNAKVNMQPTDIKKPEPFGGDLRSENTRTPGAPAQPPVGDIPQERIPGAAQSGPSFGVKPNLDPMTEEPVGAALDPEFKQKIEAGRNSPLETRRQLAQKPDVTAGRSE